MNPPENDFRTWFMASLTPMRNDPHAGFIFILTALPLLERFLRNKSGCCEGKDLTDVFFTNLGALLGDILGKERECWDCYRNGLLHQVTFPKAKLKRKTGIWVSLPEAGLSGDDRRPAYFDSTKNQFFLNPVVFFDLVTNEILANFAIYEGTPVTNYPLPKVEGGVTLTSTPAVTTFPNKTGSYSS